MGVRRLRTMSGLIASVVVVLLCQSGLCQSGMAQQVSYPLLQPGVVAPAPSASAYQPSTLPEAPRVHRFWDSENSILFAATAALNTADFIVTRNNLRSGGQELNPVTRVFSGSTPALAMNFAGETAGVIGMSYFFHKTGHHKLERVTSMLSISSSALAVTFDLSHR